MSSESLGFSMGESESSSEGLGGSMVEREVEGMSNGSGTEPLLGFLSLPIKNWCPFDLLGFEALGDRMSSESLGFSMGESESSSEGLGGSMVEREVEGMSNGSGTEPLLGFLSLPIKMVYHYHKERVVCLDHCTSTPEVHLGDLGPFLASRCGDQLSGLLQILLY
ncbi:hypothetical protein VNO78_03661 [Psophocarpus tetragonolobus]|uniref:Uncharacterized protein n=1 Tax=Psophocarpus tetragonolobus TaxID=3891 RepID=A0AAN9TDM4_PSOTE